MLIMDQQVKLQQGECLLKKKCHHFAMWGSWPPQALIGPDLGVFALVSSKHREGVSTFTETHTVNTLKKSTVNVWGKKGILSCYFNQVKTNLMFLYLTLSNFLSP